MTTPNPLERLAAAGREAAKQAAKTTAEVVAAFSGSGAVNRIERAAQAHAEAQRPKPSIELQPKGIKREARKSELEAAVEQGIADVRAHREHRRLTNINPFAAARLRQQHGTAALERGRQLDKDDEPPSAA